MTPDDTLSVESLTQVARRFLRAIGDTPVSAMDASYFEELRLIVENLLTAASCTSARPEQRVWLVWDCQEPVACYLTQQEATEACADLQHQLLSDYGAGTELLDIITVSAATLEPAECTATGVSR